MRPTLQDVKERYQYYNHLIFKDKLPMPKIQLTTALETLGCTSCCVSFDSEGKPIKSYCISVSVRLDLPEIEFIDTIVHEMIHYYIMYYNIQDDGPHGTQFKRIKDSIYQQYGIRVSIAGTPEIEEATITQTRPRQRAICVFELRNGETYFLVVAKQKVFEIWDLVKPGDSIMRVHWYASFNPVFGRYPTAVSLRAAYHINKKELEQYLADAVPLARTGNTIRPVTTGKG